MISQIIILNLLLQILNGCGELKETIDNIEPNAGRPSIIITAKDSSGNPIITGSTTNDKNINLTFTSDDDIEFVITSDGISVTNGTIANLQQNNSKKVYTATFTSNNKGECNVTIPINSFRFSSDDLLIQFKNGIDFDFTWTYIPL